MKKILILPLLFLLLLGCKDDKVTEELSGDLKLTTNRQTFDDAINKRGANYSAPFYINNIVRLGDTINIEVSHTYACQGSYEIIWNGEVMESFPYQIRLVVKFNAQCTDKPTIQVMVDEKLKVNLRDLITDNHILENVIVHVSNASSIQDVYSGDESNSNE